MTWCLMGVGADPQVAILMAVKDETQFVGVVRDGEGVRPRGAHIQSGDAQSWTVSRRIKINVDGAWVPRATAGGHQVRVWF